MRVWDAKKATYDGLRSLSWRRYLSAMWILGTELVELYADQMSGSERSLAAATLAVVRDVSASGDEAAHKRRAGELVSQWGRLIKKGRAYASGGQENVWATLEGMAAEIAGAVAHYYAASWVGNAAEDRWREPSPRGFYRVDHEEEVADDSPMARTLARFAQIVSGVARAPESEADPAVLRAQILEP